MRITLVHSRFNQLGGAERYALELAGAYAEAGHQVTILSTTSPPAGPWTADLIPIPVPRTLWRHQSVAGKIYRHLADLWPWRRAVSAQIAATRPDVVHLHNWMQIGVGAIRGLPRDIPVVHTVHDFGLADPTTTLDDAHWSRAKTAALSLRSRILSTQLRGVRLHWPSERTQRLAADFNPALLRTRTSIVPLSARATEELTSLPSDPDVAEGTTGRSTGAGTTFLFLGLLSEHKGVTDLLQAWAGRPPAAAAARLLIAGTGPLRARVEAAAEQDPSISYLGYIDADRKRQALRDAQWVLFPSRWHENFSISCVEALAAGRPILCSGIAQPPMAARSSLVVAPEPADLAAALGACAAMTAADYRTYAQSARQDGQALLWSTHVRAMLDLLTLAVRETTVCKTGLHVPDVQPR